MNVVLFSGIRIQLGHCRDACTIAALDSTCRSILGQQPLKTILLALDGESPTNKNCPGSILSRAVFTNFSGVLEEVAFVCIKPHQDLIVAYLKDYNFSNLKILKLEESYNSYDPTYMADILKPLVANAPQLQELHTRGPINLMLDVLERSSAVLVTQSYVSAPFDEIPDGAINRIRLEKMALHYKGSNFDMGRFNRITPRMLQEPFTGTLRMVELDALLGLALMSYGIRLENVSFLRFEMNCRQLERVDPRIMRILKDFDFTRIVPILVKVIIFDHCGDSELLSDHVNELVEQAHASLKEPESDRAMNIKELNLCSSISSTVAEFYAEMFPHIERLELHEEEEKVSLSSIWKHWVNLKEVDVLVYVERHAEDLESVICGIFPEEVAELRQKDEEFLRNVNIIPVMPAITCLRNLEKLGLCLITLFNRPFEFQGPGYVQPPPSLILSKVTGLGAFAKCPNLTVTVSTYFSHVYEGRLL